jgi:hypothetical protein
MALWTLLEDLNMQVSDEKKENTRFSDHSRYWEWTRYAKWTRYARVTKCEDGATNRDGGAGSMKNFPESFIPMRELNEPE